ncbi:bis-aminopropyl spermidine synthase family protein [Lipingzhangella sp. LS1_29]|uniref:Bis-aminopropyl spermidine synthase family protein n=1 Tax=Lipingzhangella rawalii TaxID=2055835 RepID=A0ABU2H5Y9_9ACTN|nr:bis-aminopropyl spermidine synthase family protein [Lipingzhangella rawalii]MDS1270716.1 bis-aminopropyl spermidine synthase family protein [Lipingzhangella rawalii]
MGAEEQAARTDPRAAVRTHLASSGPLRVPLRRLVRHLAEASEPLPLAQLVRSSGLSRRTVETFLAVLGTDLVREESGLALRPDVAPEYRDLAGTPATELDAAQLATPDAALDPQLLEQMDALVSAAPPPVAALDHVPATAHTVLRRALWLAASYELTGRRILLVGDHDLTSLALMLVCPEVEATVVDVDERLLTFVAEQAHARGARVRCLAADLRHGLPPAATGWADLAVTDPPYTPEGLRLFCIRGLAGLRDRTHGRLVVAYGFGEHQPSLGLQGQRAMQQLHLAFAAILPGFNRYHGAQATGSASDLYVCQPTPQTWKALDRAAPPETHIYTHGRQSLEGERDPVPPETVTAVWEAADVAAEASTLVVGSGLADTAAPGVRHVRLDTVLTSGVPRGARADVALGNLAGDPGGWLLRVLLALRVERLVALVPADHPDLAGGSLHPDVAALLAPLYTVDSPRAAGSGYALLRARRTDPDRLSPHQRLLRRVLERPHGTVATVWREALIALAEDLGLGRLTKNEARARIRALNPAPELLEARLVDLPRQRMSALVELVSRSADAP